MRRRSLGWLVLISMVALPSFADPGVGNYGNYDHGLLPGEDFSDIPERSPIQGLRADTTWYGQYEMIGDEAYAIPFDNKADGCWTFDRGTGPVDPPLPFIPNGEGWSVRDMTENQVAYFRVIDETLDLGDGVPPPIISGEQSLWVGADQAQADSLCWPGGAGYGNNWCQRATSVPLPYDGNGDVTLSFLYFANIEPCYDGLQIYLKRADESELLLNPYPAGSCWNEDTYEGGSITDTIGSYEDPEIYSRIISEDEIGAAQEIRFIFEFASDGGWSDEDSAYGTTYGPFGADDVLVSGGGIDAAYDFEDGLQGWSPGVCAPVGDYAGVADVDCYTILDPCQCRLEGKILEVHDGLCDAGFHPVGQHVQLRSPICDFGSSEPKTIFMEFDMYADMPQDNGVLIRAGWLYYPWTCDVTGEVGWTPRRVGKDAYNYFGDNPICYWWRYGGTEVNGGTPVPETAEKVIAMIELLGDCGAFGIDPCSDVTNFSPLFDNITVGVTDAQFAPIIGFDIGGQYQDVASFPSNLFDPRAPGPANTAVDKNMTSPPGTQTDLSGDSLVIAGPVPEPQDPNTRWEARLWFRVAKRAPFTTDTEFGMPTRYSIWKDRVADDVLGDPDLLDRPDHPEFTFGWMDSVQIGFVVSHNKFCSYFREDDDDFRGENFDASNPETEMIWDDVLLPGSRIDYFITSNYAVTPNELYYHPDTSGSYFYEFEILPGLRIAHLPECGGVGFDYCAVQPALLYIDSYNRGAQTFIEQALYQVLHGEPLRIDGPRTHIPKDRAWDRYDYQSAGCGGLPFMRGTVAGSNNGMTLNQLLGYRTILLSTGTYGGGNTEDQDYLLFSEWLTSPECGANVSRQVFIANGDQVGNSIEHPGGNDIDWHGLAFMNDKLGASMICDAFNGQGYEGDCGEENDAFCLRVRDVQGGAFACTHEVDAWGNGCPYNHMFSVYAPINGGIGNRMYEAEDGSKEMSFAQITHEDLGPEANYRTILSSPSYHHMTLRDGSAGGMDRCPREVESIIDAATAEISAALRWGFDAESNASLPKLADAMDLADCQGTGEFPAGASETASVRVNRLYPIQPNPFNPTTTVRFTLAQNGWVDVSVYDVRGRRVRTLMDGKRKAGIHTVSWNGRNDANTRVGSGIYWVQMKTGDYVSNKKMTVLK